jgi:DegV family protein with EDD domain
LAQVRIVTDSAARFEDPAIVTQYGVEIVPLNIHFGSQTLLDGVDLDSQDMFQRMRHGSVTPTASAPPVARFERLFEALNRTTDQICVLSHSRRLTDTWDNAQAARASLLGRCEIAVIDSQTTSAALGILVEETAKAAEHGVPLEEVVRIAHGIIPRLYCVYYVETLDYLRRAGLVGEAQAILGTMLGVKPFLTIENGELITMEKVRNRSQTIDRLVEFVAEFVSIERLIILQNTPRITEQTRLLQDRLMMQCADLNSPVMLYEPLLATMIGPDGMGVVVYEGVEDDTPRHGTGFDGLIA